MSRSRFGSRAIAIRMEISAADDLSILVPNGVYWWRMGATSPPATEPVIRRSISIPPEIAEKIDAIAASRHITGNRAIIDLLHEAITAYEQRRKTFFDLADRFQKSTDPAETIRLREELARMTFGA